MVDIATPTLSVHGHRSPTGQRLDDETFRVAEELMLLSASRNKGAAMANGAADEMIRKRNALHSEEAAQQMRKRQKALTAQFELLKSPSGERPLANRSTLVQQSSQTLEEIINSRCDVSHSQLLKEHRSRFRKARRRWNVERANKRRAMVAGFKVQGIPLVQHLAALTHWR